MEHASDCATHNSPARPVGACDCGAVINDLKDRIRAAEKNERDHKDGDHAARRELSGYTRGLRDALFVVRGS